MIFQKKKNRCMYNFEKSPLLIDKLCEMIFDDFAII